MSKVLTFSRVFPSYHPRKCEPTYFVEKIWESIYLQNNNPEWLGENYERLKPYHRSIGLHDCYNPKHHTIRAGHRWKVGDKFSPRVWSGQPYKSKQIIIAPDIEVKKIFTLDIEIEDDYKCIFIDRWPFYEENDCMVTQKEGLETLAMNDGLSVDDLKSWFKWPNNIYDHQIICWNENINY